MGVLILIGQKKLASEKRVNFRGRGLEGAFESHRDEYRLFVIEDLDRGTIRFKGIKFSRLKRESNLLTSTRSGAPVRDTGMRRASSKYLPAGGQLRQDIIIATVGL